MHQDLHKSPFEGYLFHLSPPVSTLHIFVHEAMSEEPFAEAYSAPSSVVLHTVLEGKSFGSYLMKDYSSSFICSAVLLL
jgi:hypothetical protein